MSDMTDVEPAVAPFDAHGEPGIPLGGNVGVPDADVDAPADGP